MSLTYLSPITNQHECQSIAVNNLTVYGTASIANSSNVILQNGNAFSAIEVIGTTDNNDVHIVRNGTTEIIVGSTGTTFTNQINLNDTEVTPKTVSLSAPTTLTASYTLKLPVNLPASPNEFIKSDTSGNLSFSDGFAIISGSGSIASLMAANSKFLLNEGDIIQLDTPSITYLNKIYTFVFPVTSISADGIIQGVYQNSGTTSPELGNYTMSTSGAAVQIMCVTPDNTTYYWQVISHN
jgi:hypothetical protein